MNQVKKSATSKEKPIKKKKHQSKRVSCRFPKINQMISKTMKESRMIKMVRTSVSFLFMAIKWSKINYSISLVSLKWTLRSMQLELRPDLTLVCLLKKTQNILMCQSLKRRSKESRVTTRWPQSIYLVYLLPTFQLSRQEILKKQIRRLRNFWEILFIWLVNMTLKIRQLKTSLRTRTLCTTIHTTPISQTSTLTWNMKTSSCSDHLWFSTNSRMTSWSLKRIRVYLIMTRKDWNKWKSWLITSELLRSLMLPYYSSSSICTDKNCDD